MKRFITVGSGLVLVATSLAASLATASNAAAELTAPAYSVTAKLAKSVVVIGEDVVKVRGTVKRSAAGDSVVLQQRLDGQKTWKKSGTAQIRANGTFLLKDKPSVAGSRFYRVVKPAADGIAKGVSSELAVVVYKWELLGKRVPGVNQNVATFSTAIIGTKYYAPSILVTTPGDAAFVEYTLGRLCTSLRTTYALDDRSASGSAGSVILTVDGATKVAQPLVVGQVVESTTDLTNAFRLRYDLGSRGAPLSMPAIAAPEVLCTK